MDIEQIYTEDMNIVVVGHVDHGKSTVIGRLLTDTNSLPIGKLEQIREKCKRNSKPFEYAFLLDALKDEQEQGITIDSARCFFRTKKRNYIIIDAPGHIEFLKNMVTGAARAEAALLVIDAYEGIQENSKRHGYLLSMLGIKQLCILVNKMDLIGYSEQIFNEITENFKVFLSKIGLETSMYIPISGYKGENIVQKSKNMTWYEGDTVLEVLEKFQVEKLPANKPFRMPVQGVYKFTAGGDTRRIIGGTVETGTLNVGDEVVFFPSGKKGRIKSIEAFNEDTKISVCAGYSTGFTLTEQIYVKRGEIATVSDQLKPQIATLIKVKLFWLSKLAMVMGKTYILKLGTSKVRIRIVKIISILDASTLQSSNSDFIGTNDVAECLLELEKPIAFDLLSYNFYLSRFVIIDHYEISGGGTIYGISEDKQNWISEKTITGNNKWENSAISEAERALKYQQNPTLIMITGLSNGGKKYISSILEKKLFNQGRIVYLLSIYYKEEHLRRLAEISNIMLDAGNILIVTVDEMSNDDLKEIKTIVDPKKIKVLWIGNNITTDIEYDLQISEDCEGEYALNIIEDYLIKSSVISSDNGKD